MALQRDLYEVLGVPKTAPLSAIKKAYRALAVKHHPDKNGGKDDGFMDDINQAYRILSDPEKRRTYDETGYYGEAHVPTVEEEALKLVGELLTKIYDRFDGWLAYIDIVGELKKRLRKSRKACQKDLAGAETEIASLEAIVKRLGESSLLGELILNLSHTHEETVIRANRFLQVNQKAGELVKTMKYTPQEIPEERREEFEEFLHPKAPQGFPGMEGLFGPLLGGLGGKE